MMNIILIKGLAGISLLTWGIISLILSFMVERFIIKRFEQESNLLQTAFFKDYIVFTKHIPGFFSSALYAAYLMMCLWGWRFYQKSRMFNDIKDPNEILSQFSTKELIQIKLIGLSYLMILLHGIALYGLNIFWPEISH